MKNEEKQHRADGTTHSEPIHKLRPKTWKHQKAQDAPRAKRETDLLLGPKIVISQKNLQHPTKKHRVNVQMKISSRATKNLPDRPLSPAAARASRKL